MKENSCGSVADKARRKATPPQTLFPDFSTAHSVIMSRPVQEDQRATPEGSQTGQGCPQTLLLSSMPHFQLPAKDRGLPNFSQLTPIEIESSDNDAGMMLQDGDIALRPLHLRCSGSVSRAEDQARNTSVSEPINFHVGSPSRRLDPSRERSPLHRRSDTISDILSDYDNQYEHHRRSQSHDSTLVVESATPAPLNIAQSARASLDPHVTSITSILSLSNYQGSSENRGTEPARLSSQIAASFGFNDSSGRELEHRFAPTIPLRLQLVVKSSNQQHDGCNDCQNIESGSFSNERHDQESRAHEYRPVSFGESTESLLLSNPGYLSEGDEEEDSKCEVSFSESTHRLSDHVQPPFRITQPLAGSSTCDFQSSLKTRGLSTDQDWETIEESVPCSKTTSTQVVSGHNQQPGTFLLGCSEPDIYDEQAQSMWSPLKTVKETTNLQGLFEEVQQRHHGTKHSVQATISTNDSNALSVARASNYQDTSATALLPFKHADIKSDNSPAASVSGSSIPKYIASHKDMSTRKHLPSPALQSSSLFPHNVVTKLDSPDSEREMDKTKNLSRMDKGKSRATDQEFDHPHQSHYHHHQYQANKIQDVGPEFNYEDMFENIVDDTPSNLWQNAPQFATTHPNIQILPIIAIHQETDKNINTRQILRVSTPQSDNSSNLSQLSRVARDYNPLSDTDVSAFLRATNPALYVSQAVDPPADTLPKRCKTTKNKNESKNGKNIENDSRAGLVGRNDGESSANRPSLRGIAATRTIDSLRSFGFGAQGFTGVKTSQGDKIGTPERMIRNETILPSLNTFGWTSRAPRLEPRCKEMAFRLRMDATNDEWSRLKHECPQFPLREEHLISPHPVKENRMLGERVQMLENGEWLEQAYCFHHKRVEFSATLGLTMRRVPANLIAQQQKAGKMAVFWASLFFPIGGFVFLQDISENRPIVADLMRYLSGDMLIDQPHGDERRLAALLLEILVVGWLVLLFAGCLGCVLAIITGKW